VAFVRTSGEPGPADALRSLNLANGFAAISSDGRRLAGVVDPGGTAGSIGIADLTNGTLFQKVTDMPASVRPRGAGVDAGRRPTESSGQSSVRATLCCSTRRNSAPAMSQIYVR
jgi:hypothetical protein